MLSRRLSVVALAAALALPAVVRAQDSRAVSIRVVFEAEARDLPTGACLQIIERAFPATRWWAGAAPASGPDAVLQAVLAAIQAKDRARLLQLTDPSQKRDLQKFDVQAAAFFQQFETIKLLDITRAYEFDDLVVYFGRFQAASRTAFVPLSFAAQGDGRFGFLPERSTRVTFETVSDWFGQEAPDAGSQRYCTAAEVAQSTHRVPLVKAAFRPSQLLLTGGPLRAPGGSTAVGRQVLARIAEMKAALKANDLESFVRFMTAEGGGRLQQWWAGAKPEERAQYRGAFLQQEPFFVFDESPLVVVYIKIQVPDAGKPTGVAPGVQLLYFTPGGSGQWLWTNSSHVTSADRIFKDAPMGTAAAAADPFASFRP